MYTNTNTMYHQFRKGNPCIRLSERIDTGGGWWNGSNFTRVEKQACSEFFILPFCFLFEIFPSVSVCVECLSVRPCKKHKEDVWKKHQQEHKHSTSTSTKANTNTNTNTNARSTKRTCGRNLSTSRPACKEKKYRTMAFRRKTSGNMRAFVILRGVPIISVTRHSWSDVRY